MTAEPTRAKSQADSSSNGSVFTAALILFLMAGVIILLVVLAASIMERRWESQRPLLVLSPIEGHESDSTVWGKNYPLEYESYRKMEDSTTLTKYGGAVPRDLLDADPFLVILYAGYGFSKDYLQARGHYHARTDVVKTARIKTPFMAATCWTCKSTDVPRLMNEMGAKAFYASNFHDLKDEIQHPIGCADCHDPQTLELTITRPALREALVTMGRDPNEIPHQEMRSLVCAQCHSEYYFKTDDDAGLKNYLTFPWQKGLGVEGMLEYYDAIDFADFTNPISGTRIVKLQHPDYELFRTGVHAYRGISCADCHMPYRTEGGAKFTDHHVQSPLLAISNSCAVCHRWSEQEIRTRVETIQDTVNSASLAAEKALAQAHFDIRAAIEAGATDEQLAPLRKQLRHAQFRWDYVASTNGMGFHAPQEAMWLIGEATDQAQQVRVAAARLLATKGISQVPLYPDISTREKAWEITQTFVDGGQITLLP